MNGFLLGLFCSVEEEGKVVAYGGSESYSARYSIPRAAAKGKFIYVRRVCSSRSRA